MKSQSGLHVAWWWPPEQQPRMKTTTACTAHDSIPITSGLPERVGVFMCRHHDLLLNLDRYWQNVWFLGHVSDNFSSIHCYEWKRRVLCYHSCSLTHGQETRHSARVRKLWSPTAALLWTYFLSAFSVRRTCLSLILWCRALVKPCSEVTSSFLISVSFKSLIKKE